MAITENDVRHIAQLASLSMPEDSMASFCARFQSILDYMDILNAVDTTHVEPLYSPLETGAPYRDDCAVRTAAPGDVLKNAPECHETFYEVPKIV